MRARPTIVCLVLAVAATTLQAQGERQVDISDRLGVLASGQLSERASAFYDLMRAGTQGGVEGKSWLIPDAVAALLKASGDRAGVLRSSLIDLLAREGGELRSASAFSEEQGSYHGDLIAAVGALRDPAALPVLLDEMETGNIATRAVAQQGRNALAPVLSRLATGDVKAKVVALRVIYHMLSEPGPSAELIASDRQVLKDRLVEATTDGFYPIRIAAIQGLARFGEPDVLSLLTRLAETDPEARISDGGTAVYPVRQVARQSLAAMLQQRK